MQPLPHLYNVQIKTTPESEIKLSSQGIPDLVASAPAEFGGPGDQWSPETLFMSSIASCFALSFKAVAGASSFTWKGLQCEAIGQLEKVERTIKFTQITTKVKLTIGNDVDKQKAIKLIEKSESICLVTNSVSANVKLEYDIVIEE
ncbi:OsmC family protein [Psychromonas sp. PT13]|uniref:OsmC family protein n=1 Tax=Psychromonas sp. PT13 TaxID=3439547 RepID=UPI003EB80FFA